ncbi:cell division protein FtsA [Hathewaya proteolytica DSM 3090]|uniref:Cell division protein FtsA n=1 Tax=Hathewaya proteolytica DSM 3090 TaxID=1121331 RepID=A0A1M6JCH1_9CLOT|nr:cell division protein FtsA [Hathewaya proteolytica]SHJ44324.1 cell division protein FtsA [Hathewaya proteolytica DSM 3090]
MYSYIVGIDIGASKICASVGRVSEDGRISIMGTTMTQCKGVKKGCVVNIDETAEAIEKCIFSLEKIVEFKINEAYISISAGLCSLVNNKGVIAIDPESNGITYKDINRVIEVSKLITLDEDKHVIECIPSEFVVDGAAGIKNPLGMSGTKLEADVQVVLVQKSLMQNLIKSVNKSGIKVLGVMIQSMGLKSSVLMDNEAEAGVAIVDIGHDTINISIFKQDLLQKTIFIPLGGNNITKDLSICLKISYEDAEKLKRRYAVVSSKIGEDEKIVVKLCQGNEMELDLRKFYDIINARVEETLKYVKAFIKENVNYDDINSVVLVGGGFTFLKDIQNISERILDKKVRIGIPQLIGTVSPLYATSVGIVLDAANNIKFDSYDNKDKISKDEDYSDEDLDKILERTLKYKDEHHYEDNSTYNDEKDDFCLGEDFEADNHHNKSFKDKVKDFFADFF